MGTSSVKRPKPTDLLRFRLAYFVEIARGSSVIVSTLSSASRAAAVSETLDDFVYWRGKEDLPVYVELLAERLESESAYGPSPSFRPPCRRYPRHIRCAGDPSGHCAQQPDGSMEGSNASQADIHTNPDSHARGHTDASEGCTSYVRHMRQAGG
jgi:hypothetical protein